MARLVWRVILASLRLAVSPSQHRAAWSVLRARRITTRTHPRLARPAHQVVTQRVAMLTTASDVPWGDLQRPLEEQASPRASRVSPGSTRAMGHQHAQLVSLAQPTSTETQPPGAPPAQTARTQAVVAQLAICVSLVRWTRTRIPRHHVLTARPGGTGSTAIHVWQCACLARQVRLMLTLTAPHLVRHAPLESILTLGRPAAITVA